MGSNVVKGIAIIGSTGSIGRQTLEVVRAFPEQLRVVGLAGWRNVDLLQTQFSEFNPKLVWSHNASLPSAPRSTLARSMEEVACHPDVDLVVMATSGLSGLTPTLAALRAGKAVALASKEAIVMAGAIIAEEMRAGARLLPVDSEPSAIWQCLQGEEQDVVRLIITASGGAFRDRPPEQLASVTPQEALRHPTWEMGRKITIDSATLMNKAFEVIEAHWLFDVAWERIEAVLHPQSIVHSFVEFHDGSIKAQMAPPDMRLPLQYALFYPKRLSSNWTSGFDIARIGSLDFSPLDESRYPCYRTGLNAGMAGGTYPAALCAADDAVVELFLEGRIGFLDIPRLVEGVLDEHSPGNETSLDDILGAADWAGQRARELAGV